MEIIQQFGVNQFLLAAQVVNFLVLLFILKRFLYKPLLKVLQERKQKIAQSLENAEQIQRQLEQTELDREKAIEKASIEAQKIIETARQDATDLIQEAGEQAKLQVQALIKSGQQQIESDRIKMQQQLKSELAGIVTIALEKITEQTLGKKEQKTILDRTIKEL